MSKDSRSGGKFTGNHTTLTELSAIACDLADKCPYVTKISPGYLKSGLSSVNGNRRVKIAQRDGFLFLSARSNISQQEIWVYVSDRQQALEAISRGLRNRGIAICFEKKQSKPMVVPSTR